MPRRPGVVQINPDVAKRRVERVQQMVDDPETYFANARVEARELVLRDMERERQLNRRSITMSYAKAVISALIAFLTALATGLTDGGLSASEWIAAVIAGLVSFGAVYGVPNKPTAE